MDTHTTKTEASPAGHVEGPDPMLAERCDRCGQRAYVVTSHLIPAKRGPMEMPLSWCAHHFTENEAALVARGSARVIVDRREDLLGIA